MYTHNSRADLIIARHKRRDRIALQYGAINFVRESLITDKFTMHPTIAQVIRYYTPKTTLLVSELRQTENAMRHTREDLRQCMKRAARSKGTLGRIVDETEYVYVVEWNGMDSNWHKWEFVYPKKQTLKTATGRTPFDCWEVNFI